MSTSAILVLTWLVAANVTGMIPLRGNHWPAAYVLIAIGIPILGYMVWENGPVLGLISLAAGASILRWPVVYLWRWVKRVTGRTTE
ncbi:MAG: DUF2484 family protein [Paracoccaceae bacterium]